MAKFIAPRTTPSTCGADIPVCRSFGRQECLPHRLGRKPRRSIRCAALLFVPAAVFLAGTDSPPPAAAAAKDAGRFLDLSLLVAPEYPCTWPTFPPFQLNPYQRIGPLSAYNSDVIVMDGNAQAARLAAAIARRCA